MPCRRGPAPVDKRGGDSMSRWTIVGMLFGLGFQLMTMALDECRGEILMFRCPIAAVTGSAARHSGTASHCRAKDTCPLLHEGSAQCFPSLAQGTKGTTGSRVKSAQCTLTIQLSRAAREIRRGSPHGRHGPGSLGSASPMSWLRRRTSRQLQVSLGAETIEIRR